LVPHNFNNNVDIEVLRRFGIIVVQFISDIAIDPHTYFEKQFSGELLTANTDLAVLELVAQISSWLESLEFSARQYTQLDRRLADAGLPDAATVSKSLAS
jgi:hypothetical protein